MKKTRARSVADKDIIFKRILVEGRNLFLEYGSKNFTMRSLAKRLNLAQGSLYTYVKSKRELWYAIVNDDLKQIEEKMENIRKTHQGKRLELLEKIVEFFFETLKTNKRFLQLMFKTNPPNAKTIGPIEREFEIGIIRILDEIINEAALNREIKMDDISKLALYVWNLMYGNAIIAYTDKFGLKENLPGYSNSLEYYSFVIKLLNKLIISLKKK
jgi:AcrR family transcriptional regulator